MNRFVNFSTDDEDTNLERLYNTGVSHTKRGNPCDAIFYFDKVLEIKPGMRSKIQSFDLIDFNRKKYYKR